MIQASPLVIGGQKAFVEEKRSRARGELVLVGKTLINEYVKKRMRMIVLYVCLSNR